jgi:hypothetical protein
LEVSTRSEISLHLIVREPPEGVALAMQRGKDGLLRPTKEIEDAMVFEFSLTVADLEAVPVRLTGEFAQGPADGRFVYVRAGTLAGQPGSPWTRRAKVPLSGVTADAIQRAIETGQPLIATVAGTAPGGGPFFASVPLLSGWQGA